MIQFQSIKRIDNETLNLFRTIHKNFGSNNTKKQLSGIIKNCVGHFYKVYYDYEFIGCVFFDTWKDKTVNFGGFSKRGTHLKNIQAIKAICDKYKGCTIQAKTEFKEARICLLRAGFKKIKGMYEYVKSS